MIQCFKTLKRLVRQSCKVALGICTASSYRSTSLDFPMFAGKGLASAKVWAVLNGWGESAVSSFPLIFRFFSPVFLQISGTFLPTVSPEAG